MAVSLTYPGVYVQEIPSAVHTIVGVPTSVAAFVGAAERGPANAPQQIDSWAAYARLFGQLSDDFPMSWAVYLFFVNGGATAQVVRAGRGGKAATIDLGNGYEIEASSPGEWGEGLQVALDRNELTDKAAFNMVVTEVPKVENQGVATPEQFRGLTADKIKATLERSALVQLKSGATPKGLPTMDAAGDGGDGVAGAGGAGGAGAADEPAAKNLRLGTDPVIDWDAVGGDKAEGLGEGIYALASVDIFNMLCLPTDVETTWGRDDLSAALNFCKKHRAMLIVDPPTVWGSKTDLTFQDISGNTRPVAGGGDVATYAAMYYPNLVVAGTKPGEHKVGPCGAVAGVWAATDAARGVWKAPAGTTANVVGIRGFTAFVDDPKSGVLNRQAVNALRTKPLYGPVVWGARTAAGADGNANEWKYLPVRRTALYIEESLRRATQWAVFEPNDEPLWASLRLNAGVFMHSTWRAGAFQGATPAEAYFVKCDKDVNPQAQVDLGIVNIVVGFAPLKPAEFVVISIQQLQGQLET